MSNNNTVLNFRPPPSSASSSSSFSAPSANFLRGTWHVTHSTLPMWKKNRNVRITYTPTEDGAIDDLVEYQPIGSTKWKTINGIDRLETSDTHAATWNWRGKGWLMIASSRWSVIGWGEEEGGWAVTFFEKTLFTPAGIDVYARGKEGLSPELLGRITEGTKSALEREEALSGFVEGMFEILRGD